MFKKVKQFLNSKKQIEQPAQPVQIAQPVQPDVVADYSINKNTEQKMALDKKLLRYLVTDAFYAYVKEGRISQLGYRPLYYEREHVGICIFVSRDKACVSDVHYVQETFADYGIKSEILSYNTQKVLFVSAATIAKLDENKKEFIHNVAPVILRDGSRPYALTKRCKEINDKLWAKPKFVAMISCDAER